MITVRVADDHVANLCGIDTEFAQPFDDFGFEHMYNLVEQMRRVLPEVQFQQLQPDADVFDSFFLIDITTIVLPTASAPPP